jgi:uncharacterized protein (TIGR02001 family)
MSKRPAICIALILASCLAASPGRAAEVSASAGIVSDYRYRGLSLSDGKPAVQASISLEQDSGFYGEVWGSTIDEPGFAAKVEIDLTAGYAVQLAENLQLDVSTTYFLYPGEASSNYAEASVVAEMDLGRTSPRFGLSLAPPQRGTEDEEGRAGSNLYSFVGVSHEVGGLPLTLDAELGWERGVFDETPGGGKWDWQLGADYRRGVVRAGLRYGGSDLDGGADAITALLFLDL